MTAQPPAMIPEEIQYSTIDSVLGTTLIAQSIRGVCAVQFCDSVQDGARELARLFPGARTIFAPNTLPSMAERAIQALTTGQQFDTLSAIALDIRGSPFQEAVWRALRKVPRGASISYSQLAAAIGKPRAARPVATACGANRIALLIPCHRIIRGNGELSGYRWGQHRKSLLLEWERASVRS